MNLPIYNKKRLILAFEYAIALSDVAREQKIELTPEIIKRAENILLKEWHKSPERIAVDFTVNILAAFEPK